MIIYDELKKDHDQVKDMLARIAEMSSRASTAKTKLFEELKAAMTAHSRAEEKVFYDALKQQRGMHDQVLEAYEEHHVVDVLLREIARLSPSDDKWIAKFAVLKENIEHHVEEEENDVFAKAQEVLDGADAERLGAAFAAEKEKRLARAG